MPLLRGTGIFDYWGAMSWGTGVPRCWDRGMPEDWGARGWDSGMLGNWLWGASRVRDPRGTRAGCFLVGCPQVFHTRGGCPQGLPGKGGVRVSPHFMDQDSLPCSPSPIGAGAGAGGIPVDLPCCCPPGARCSRCSRCSRFSRCSRCPGSHREPPAGPGMPGLVHPRSGVSNLVWVDLFLGARSLAMAT